jgi:hypothetical protein
MRAVGLRASQNAARTLNREHDSPERPDRASQAFKLLFL